MLQEAAAPRFSPHLAGSRPVRQLVAELTEAHFTGEIRASSQADSHLASDKPDYQR